MASPYVGEVRMLGCSYAPLGWALCNGQLMSITQNAVLFAVISTRYGGNGKSNFALPNLQGCVPVCAGQSAGTSDYVVGQAGGVTDVTLLPNQIPSHTHALQANAAPAFGSSPDPTANVFSGGQWVQPPNSGNAPLYTSQKPDTELNGGAIDATGWGQRHNNMMPYLAINFCIALNGVVPEHS